MGLEFELKFAATPQAQAAIEQALSGSAAFTSIEMATTYYDTPGRDLSRRHCTLRRRLENGRSICTVKTPAGDIGRGEWEVEADSIEAAIPMLCKLGCQIDLLSLTAGGVEPVCGARFTRRCAVICQPDCSFELALDRGVLLGGGKEQPLCEIELELKSGSQAALIACAAALSRHYGLQRQTKSKFRRAMDLAQEG